MVCLVNQRHSFGEREVFVGFMEHLYVGRVNFEECLKEEIIQFARLHNEILDMKSEKQLHENMRILLSNGKTTGDIILRSEEGAKYSVHKFILAAR